MTCASCAAAIAKTLDKMDGVTASVNFATDGAKATHDPSVHPGDLVATVEATGYRATLPIPATADPLDAGEVPDDREREAAAWWQRLVISAVLTAPVLAMSMVPAWRVDNWQWLPLTLASPVVVWRALPFHRAAWTNLRHGAATMDTLITIPQQGPPREALGVPSLAESR